MLSTQLDGKENRKLSYIVDVHLYMHEPLLLKKEMFA